MDLAALLSGASRMVLPTAVAVIMFCLGLELRRADFARMLRQPRLLAVAIPCQLALLPLAAWVLGQVLGLSPSARAGLLLVAACPVSAPASLLARLARAEVAVAITLTALTAPAAAITIPLVLRASGYGASHVGGSGAVLLWKTSVSVGMLVTVPVVLAMALRGTAPVLTRWLEPRAIRLAVVVFVIGLGVAVAAAWKAIPGSFATAGFAAALLNVLGLLATGTAARFAGISASQRLVLVLGSTTRQFAVAAFVSLTLYHDAQLLVPALAYCIIMWVPPVGAVLLTRIRAGAAGDAMEGAAGA